MALSSPSSLFKGTDELMEQVALYCKSYRQDVKRARRLALSVSKFNDERLPFFLSVPKADLKLFEEHLHGLSVSLISDEEIIHSNPSIDPKKIASIPGGLSQQIVKSEFWRLKLSEAYVCVDSDCQFIRPFGRSDFMTPEGYPYTVMHEAKELLQFAAIHDMPDILKSYKREHEGIMRIFERAGRAYDFGPPPMIWGAAVWRDLDEKFLKPRNMSFLDAIMQFPAEILWYGEAMLKFRPYPLMPVEPIFKFYHYEPQFIIAQRDGETPAKMAKNFLGVVYQSNWEKDIDFEPKKRGPLSRLARAVRRNVFGRYR